MMYICVSQNCIDFIALDDTEKNMILFNQLCICVLKCVFLKLCKSICTSKFTKET